MVSPASSLSDGSHDRFSITNPDARFSPARSDANVHDSVVGEGVYPVDNATPVGGLILSCFRPISGLIHTPQTLSSNSDDSQSEAIRPHRLVASTELIFIPRTPGLIRWF